MRPHPARRSRDIAMRGLLAGCILFMARPALAADRPRGLTAVAGIKVGHHTLSERPTGCTAVLAEAGAVAGVDVRGGAPGTLGTDMLDPVSSVPKLYGVVLAGGSAFGLDAVAGTVRFLKERGVGHQTRGGKVPLVAGAILFDLGVGKADVWPTAECGYKAAGAASDGPVAEGSVGAGAGATLGKLGSLPRAMKGGIGTASLTLPSSLTVAALVAVNAVGDVVDPATGRIVAGARRPDSDAFADARLLVRAGTLQAPPRTAENTTLAVVATNAALTKAEATKVAQMAHDGYARALSPVHTPRDGDTIFALATGALSGSADLTLVGSLAAEVVADAIVRAAQEATGVPGFPAVRDLPTATEPGPTR